jgi:hypothetical protein
LRIESKVKITGAPAKNAARSKYVALQQKGRYRGRSSGRDSRAAAEG